MPWPMIATVWSIAARRAFPALAALRACARERRASAIQNPTDGTTPGEERHRRDVSQAADLDLPQTGFARRFLHLASTR